jgi:hypothetical protein
MGRAGVAAGSTRIFGRRVVTECADRDSDADAADPRASSESGLSSPRVTIRKLTGSARPANVSGGDQSRSLAPKAAASGLGWSTLLVMMDSVLLCAAGPPGAGALFKLYGGSHDVRR